MSKELEEKDAEIIGLHNMEIILRASRDKLENEKLRKYWDSPMDISVLVQEAKEEEEDV